MNSRTRRTHAHRTLRSDRPRRLLAVLGVVATAAVAGTTLVAPGASAGTDDRSNPAAHSSPDRSGPLVFGHRGAPGYRPEHTLAGYELAIKLGADFIEPDLVPTKDGVLVARHENDITGTTDVADHPEFADRKTTKTIDGNQVTGWFTEDFTLAELKTLRAKERLPEVRDGNVRYDGRFKVPTFTQVLKLVQKWEKKLGHPIGVAPETKHPTYFDSIGLSTEEPMLRDLEKFGYGDGKGGDEDDVLIQSFEITNLKQLNKETDLPLEQLVDATGAPFDQVRLGTGYTFDDMVTPAGLAKIAKYADWVGPEKGRVVPRDETNHVLPPTDLTDDAHDVGLRVVVFTLRDENQFMAADYQRCTDGVCDPNRKGDIRSEITDLLDAGVDAVFADYADSAVDARDAWLKEN